MDVPLFKPSRKQCIQNCKFTLWVITFSNLRLTAKANAPSLFGRGKPICHIGMGGSNAGDNTVRVSQGWVRTQENISSGSLSI